MAQYSKVRFEQVVQTTEFIKVFQAYERDYFVVGEQKARVVQFVDKNFNGLAAFLLEMFSKASCTFIIA